MASYLGHVLADRDPYEEVDEPDLPEPIDEASLVCHRKLHVPVDRPGIAGSMMEAECVGSDSQH